VALMQVALTASIAPGRARGTSHPATGSMPLALTRCPFPRQGIESRVVHAQVQPEVVMVELCKDRVTALPSLTPFLWIQF
jgi:hypothetical protein